MKVRLVLSQPAGGKTTFCVEKICRIRRENPFAFIRVIVPDKMQMAWWKQSLSQKSTGLGYGSGFIGTEVISFSKLAINILNVVPNSPVLIPSRLDSLCVREAIERVSDEQTLSYFEPIREKPGTLAVIDNYHCLEMSGPKP